MGLLSSIGKKLIGDPTKGYSEGIDTTTDYYNRASAKLQPYEQFGRNYMSEIGKLMAQGRPTGESIRSTPGYQFRFDEGTRALENSAISKGGLLSGNAMRAITEYGQDYASSEYDKELDRDNNRFAQLMQLLGVGYGAAAGGANLDSSTGNNLARLMTGRSESDFRAGMGGVSMFKDINEGFNKWFGD